VTGSDGDAIAGGANAGRSAGSVGANSAGSHASTTGGLAAAQGGSDHGGGALGKIYLDLPRDPTCTP
jgi:hypothetical protein